LYYNNYAKDNRIENKKNNSNYNPYRNLILTGK